MKTLLRRRKQAELRISGTGVDTARGAAVSFLFLRTDNMKILIIGGGGREHAIAWKLRQSARVEKIWCAPGNGGISRDAECVALNGGDVKAAADLAMKLGVDLTIVGPELPLVQGIADEFKQRGLAVLGPAKNAALLEGSKIFAKEFMTRNEIPTAGVYGTFDSPREADAKLDSVAWPGGGMGTYSTDGMLTRELEEQILAEIVRPTLAGLRKEGMEYRGFIFFGLMLTKVGPKVLEYNCRLGDPETQAILLRADFDFAAACMDAAQGKLDGFDAKWTRGASVCVVMASEGYPASPVLGKPIIGLEQAERVPNVAVFHAGTRREVDNYYTSGGRVLGVAAVGESVEVASRAAYDAVSRIEIAGAHYRKDIGMTDIKKTKIAEVRANG